MELETFNQIREFDRRLPGYKSHDSTYYKLYTHYNKGWVFTLHIKGERVSYIGYNSRDAAIIRAKEAIRERSNQ